MTDKTHKSNPGTKSGLIVLSEYGIDLDKTLNRKGEPPHQPLTLPETPEGESTTGPMSAAGEGEDNAKHDDDSAIDSSSDVDPDLSSKSSDEMQAGAD